MSIWLCSRVNGLKQQRVVVFYGFLALLSFNMFATEHASHVASEVVYIDPEVTYTGSDESYISSDVSYIGSQACIDCHRTQVEAWQGSHHDMAMKHASDESVLGNFNDQTVTHNGKANQFFRRGDEFWVNIEGPEGQFKDYKISYTFAFEPLQQYMVEFEDGCVQLIPFAWDSPPLAG